MRKTAFHLQRMFFHMKTTLTIDDGVMRRLKAEAARRGCTMSELVESALRMLLRPQPGSKQSKAPLPTFDMGHAKVDVADREALEEVMEEAKGTSRAG